MAVIVSCPEVPGEGEWEEVGDSRGEYVSDSCETSEDIGDCTSGRNIYFSMNKLEVRPFHSSGPSY